MGLCLSNNTFVLLLSVRCPSCCLAELSAPKMFANEGRNEEGGGGGKARRKKKNRTKRRWGRRYMNQSIRESLCEYVISPLRLKGEGGARQAKSVRRAPQAEERASAKARR